MVDKTPSLEEFFAASQLLGMSAVPLKAVVSSHPDLAAEMKGFDPLKIATTFAGLLTEPELQSNCFRLEILVHLALVFGKGQRTPNRKQITRWFSILDDGPCGRLEDPAEDVFVTLISTSRGNFRVLEGIWESAGFNLQRIVNVVDDMPTAGGLDHLRDSIYALLKLSDIICAVWHATRKCRGLCRPVRFDSAGSGAGYEIYFQRF